MTQACLQAYALVRHEGRLADRAIDSTLRQKRTLYSHERREVADRVYALLRRQITVDFLLAKTLPSFGKQTTSQQDLLRLCGARVLGGEPVAEVAADARLLPSEAATLEAFVSASKQIAGWDLRQRVWIGGSLPEFLADKVLSELGEEAEAVVDAMNQRAPLTVRANTLRVSREQLAERLEKEAVATRTTPLSPLGLFLESRPNAFSLQAFRDGLFELQDEGSQLLGMLVDAPPKLVVDACAGTGGKSLQLAAQMKNRGELHALDVDRQRVGELKKRARRAGAHNIRIRVVPPNPATAVAALDDLQNRADRVLVDAPCSGTGTYRRKPDGRYRLTPAQLEAHVERQHQLLHEFARLVKPGGRLIYGTCSILREENESAIERFLAENPSFSQISLGPVLGETLERRVASGNYLRLLPHRHGTDGFFAAVLRRG